MAYIVQTNGLDCIQQWLILYRPMACTVTAIAYIVQSKGLHFMEQWLTLYSAMVYIV